VQQALDGTIAAARREFTAAGVTRFHRRGRAAVRTEWRLCMATHNLLKLHNHHLAGQAA
jgi:hypothetical protein